MTTRTTQTDSGSPASRGFKPWRVIAGVSVALLLLPVWAQWYSNRVSLPRYCRNPDQTLAHLERVLREQEPAGDQTRRPYIVAAKLLFLMPQAPEEPVRDYLARVAARLDTTCR